MRVDDSLRDPQAEADSHIGLGGEKSAKDFGKMLGGNAATGVAYGDAGVAARLPDMQVQLSAVTDGIERIGNQIGNNLFDFAAMCVDVHRRRPVLHNVRTLGLDAVGVQSENFVNQAAEINGAAAVRRLCKRKRLVHEMSSTQYLLKRNLGARSRGF